MGVLEVSWCASSDRRQGKHVLSDALGRKVKKNELLRVAVRLLLKQTQTKVKSELAAIALSSEAAPD